MFEILIDEVQVALNVLSVRVPVTVSVACLWRGLSGVMESDQQTLVVPLQLMHQVHTPHTVLSRGTRDPGALAAPSRSPALLLHTRYCHGCQDPAQTRHKQDLPGLEGVADLGGVADLQAK